MKPKFFYKIEVEVVLTDEELNLLGMLAASHYDMHCRSVAQVNGFLYGMNNHQRWSLDAEPTVQPTHQLEWGEIDTLCKILEMRDQLSPVQSLIKMNRPKLLAVANALAERLHGLLKAINDEHSRMNPEPRTR